MGSIARDPAAELPRVLQVHTRYRRPGGEDAVVEAERTLLETAGIPVAQVAFDNRDLDDRRIAGRIRSAASAVWSRSAARAVGSAIDRHGADVVHVHNTFLAASPAVYQAASRRGAAVVQSLHNYRFACPAGTAFRDGAVCTECIGQQIPWPAVVHASYRASRSQSAVAALTVLVPRVLGIVRRDIGAFLALTRFQRDLLVRGGLPAARVRVVPNFLEPDPGSGGDARQGVLFVGRLDEEKGVATLLAAASRVPGVVRIIGDGPLRERVERAASSGAVTYLDAQPRERVIEELKHSVALVVPSVWFEGMPMVLLEAHATGTPVIASSIGGLAELVEDGVTGTHVRPTDAADLASRLAFAAERPAALRAMGVAARTRYIDRWRGPGHLAALLDAYGAALRHEARRRPAGRR